MILPIRTVPDPILRQKTQTVQLPLAAEHKKLIRDMLDTVREAKGIGLAAPQVGSSVKIIVVNLEHLDVPAFALINPVITKFSRRKTEMEEGCLSIPGIFGIVERPEKIEFKAYDGSGTLVGGSCEGLMSKVIQHEIDHINGILITDKMKKVTQGKDIL